MELHTESPSSPALSLFAMEVGSAFADEMGFVGEQADMARWTALRVGERLAERGRPGNWHAIDGQELAVALMTARPRDREEFVRVLAPMMVWLVQVEVLLPRRVRRILGEMRQGLRHCPRSRPLVDQALAVLDATPGVGPS